MGRMEVEEAEGRVFQEGFLNSALRTATVRASCKERQKGKSRRGKDR